VRQEQSCFNNNDRSKLNTSRMSSRSQNQEAGLLNFSKTGNTKGALASISVTGAYFNSFAKTCLQGRNALCFIFAATILFALLLRITPAYFHRAPVWIFQRVTSALGLYFIYFSYRSMTRRHFNNADTIPYFHLSVSDQPLIQFESTQNSLIQLC
jgi:hypothetical protein